MPYKKTNHIVWILLLSFLVLLSGCSTTTVTKWQDNPVKVPESLLKSPCTPYSAGDTLSTLTTAYIKNVTCIGEYESNLESIRQYNNRVATQGEDNG